MSITLARACRHSNDFSQMNVTLWQHPWVFSALLANPIQSSASVPDSACHASWACPSWLHPQRFCLAIPWLHRSPLAGSESRPLLSCLPRLSQGPKLSHFVVSWNWYSVQSSGNPSPSHPCLFSVNQWSFFQSHMLFDYISVIMSLSFDWTWISSWLLLKLCTVVDTWGK